MWEAKLVKFLKIELETIKKKNPRFSLRAFSNKLDVGFGTLSDFINEKRQISPSLALKVIDKTSAEIHVKNKLKEEIKKDLQKNVVLLPQDAIRIVENWQYFVVLNLLEMSEEYQHRNCLAKSVGVSLKKINALIRDLEEWGFLVVEGDKITVNSNSWTTTDDIPNESIRKAHLHSLTQAQEALLNLPVEDRDITSFVFPGNSKNLSLLKQEVRKFLTKASKMMSKGKKDTVYKMNIQVFPLNKKKTRP
ncbi:MAG: DUF4423 domain-containing protein [Bdellovibrionaceae bacterium]|nr:DUF4423 domain-containing protein [Pseudobdellovibrionaceae bacterium]NUM60433.1 DUF4423 domain-containing protein [Pseudobdellovibrionaceae bacterium]